MSVIFTFAGVDRDVQNGWTISEVANGRNTCQFSIVSADGSYKAALDDVLSVHTPVLAVTLTESGYTVTATTPTVHEYRVDDSVIIIGATQPQYNGVFNVASVIGSTSFTYVCAVTSLSPDTGTVQIVLFAGYLTTVTIAGLNNEGLAPLASSCTASDWNALPDRRYVSEAIPPGTLKQALQQIVTYLSAYGVVLDPNQVNGPSLVGLIYDYTQMTQVLDDLTALSGYTWEIDYLQILRMTLPTAITAPFNVVSGDGNVVGDVAVTPMRAGYFNRIVAKAKAALQPIVGENHVGNYGTIYQLNRIAVTPPPLVGVADTVNYAVLSVGTYGSDDMLWTFEAATNSLHQGTAAVTSITRVGAVATVTTALPHGLLSGSPITMSGAVETNYNVTATLTVTGPNTFTYTVSGTPATPATGTIRYGQPVLTSSGFILVSYSCAMIAIAEDSGEEIAHGVYETVIVVDVPGPIQLQAFANAYLAAHLPKPVTIGYGTYSRGIRPGQIQTVNIANRGINNTFLITDVQTQHWESTGVSSIKRQVTATEGSIYRPELAWRDLYSIWSSGEGAGTSVAAGSGAGGTGGGAVFFLGGSAIEYVRSSGPSWIPIDAMQISLNTVTRGSLTAIVTVRLRARSGSVTARLYNLSDLTTSGTSVIVSSPTWTTVIFIATLAAGIKVYELQVLPSLANVDVAAVGYLE